jgi:translation elongation factor EF-Tu-like GTPase
MVISMPQIGNVEVEVTLIPTAQGGRNSWVASGYRPQFRYAGQDWDAEFTFEVSRVQPGETAKAVVRFLSPEAHRGVLAEGTTFELREGVRVVGHGTVTKLLAL